MELIKTVVIVFLSFIVIGSIIILYLYYIYFSKWRRVYNLVQEGMEYIISEHDPAEYDVLCYIIKEEYGLTEEQARACIENWSDKLWFKQQTFLK